jgi:hypothetical protein
MEDARGVQFFRVRKQNRFHVFGFDVLAGHTPIIVRNSKLVTEPACTQN